MFTTIKKVAKKKVLIKSAIVRVNTSMLRSAAAAAAAASAAAAVYYLELSTCHTATV